MSHQTLNTLIVGGTTAAISAALELKRSGRSVAIVTHRNYLGEDVCDSLRLVLPVDMDLQAPLADRLYGEAVRGGKGLRPMHLKRELDRICAEADIPVLLSVYPVALETDAAGLPSALRVQSLSGSSTLHFDQLLDGSLRGEMARLHGLPMTGPQASIKVTRRVIGGACSPGEEAAWVREGVVTFAGKEGPVTEALWAYQSTDSLEDGSWRAWMALEQRTRMAAYRPGQALSADGIFALTGERLRSEQSPTDDDESILSAVSACGRRLWFAGPVVPVDDATRDALLRHDGALLWGQRLAGLMLAHAVEPSTDPARSGPARPEIEMPVDTLVVGGGTGGAPAGIAAARCGVNTLVVEYLSGLGGVGTLGLIGKYWFGNRVGFTAEVDAGCAALTPEKYEEDCWSLEAKMQWYHHALTEAGGVVWYKSTLLNVLRKDDQITGAIIGTPQGPVTVNAGVVVDASGAAAVTAKAGGETVGIGQGHLAVQGTGLPGREPGRGYGNTDYDFIDESDAKDLASAHVTAREKFRQAFDAGQLVDSRERRRIVGDYEVTPMDIRLRRIFPDTITLARSNFDTHGFTVHPLFMIVPPDHAPLEGPIPLRALLSRGLEGLLSTGLGISAHRDAMPVIRMQADVQNQGYAAGLIAAMAASTTGGRVRDLEIDSIQDKLVEIGILAPDMARVGDSFPLAETEIDHALAAAPDTPDQIDRLFTLPDAERDARLRAAFDAATDLKAQRFFAFVLGVLGDGHGSDVLADEVQEMPWDAGWDYRGMGQFGESMSSLDARLIALGRCRQIRHQSVLMKKAATLPHDAAFSHYRALAEALETLGHPDGIPVLESLLQRPGVMGHSIRTVDERRATATANPTETRFRNASLIELHLAAALYRLERANIAASDVLRNYAGDLRGLFAKYARQQLAEG